ncbi:MAG: PH domain-containing protein [Propionibacteriales bacterium]|nr:PH domain-containing protein [Propionibacteriales bacterium]
MSTPHRPDEPPIVETAPGPSADEATTPPDDEQALAAQAAAGVSREQRPHPLTPLIRGWIVLLAAVFYIGKEFIPNGSRRGGELPPLQWILGAVGVVALLVGLGSFITWWFTKYVIDAQELRIETGMLNKRSRKIAFDRVQSVDLIQPLGARLFQLAELRIEVGGAEAVKIRYLKRKDATRLRDYLLARAHGQQAEVESVSDADVLADRSSTDHVIATISPVQLVTGFLLSAEFLISAFFLVTAVIITSALGVILFALAGLLPAAIGLFSLISRRLITQFNFSLADTGRGLRITRGLTNLTSQSLPIDRIQGLRISQDALWRLKDWYRVEVDVLGYADQNQGQNNSDASSLLLPVATRAQLNATLAYCLNGADHEGIEMHAMPKQARWLRWWNSWTIRYGVNDRLAVNEIGWLFKRTEIIPHAKTQSVRIERGPLQRRLGVATVHIDTTKGPVNWSAPHLSNDVARDFAFGQLDRARAARAAIDSRRGVRFPDDPRPRGNPAGSVPVSDDPHRVGVDIQPPTADEARERDAKVSGEFDRQ